MKPTAVADSIVLPSHTDITQSTKRAIDKSVANVLREAGIYEPPVRIERVLEHLELYREFYDLEDPSLLAKVKHKMQVCGLLFRGRISFVFSKRRVRKWPRQRTH